MLEALVRNPPVWSNHCSQLQTQNGAIADSLIGMLAIITPMQLVSMVVVIAAILIGTVTFTTSWADHINYDLYYADLRYSYLYHADLSGADLAGADLRGTILEYADLSGADLVRRQFSGCQPV